jgi:Rieske Fe-S protein
MGRCRLLRSQSGVKRTWACALHMSAFDPKRTSVVRCEPLMGVVLAPIKALV